VEAWLFQICLIVLWISGIINIWPLASSLLGVWHPHLPDGVAGPSLTLLCRQIDARL